MHKQARLSGSNTSIQLPLRCKERVINAATAAVVYKNLSLNSAYHKTGFIKLVKILIEIEMSHSSASSIGMSSLSPIATAFQEGVMRFFE